MLETWLGWEKSWWEAEKGVGQTSCTALPSPSRRPPALARACLSVLRPWAQDLGARTWSLAPSVCDQSAKGLSHYL